MSVLDGCMIVVVANAGIIIWVKPHWQIADPMCTFLFGLLVIWSTIQILNQSLGVLMETVPTHVDLEGIEKGKAKHMYNAATLYGTCITQASVMVKMGQWPILTCLRFCRDTRASECEGGA